MKRKYTDEVRTLKQLNKDDIQFGEEYEKKWKPSIDDFESNLFCLQFFGDCFSKWKYYPKTNQLKIGVNEGYNEGDFYGFETLIREMMKWNIFPLPKLEYEFQNGRSNFILDE